MLSSRRVVSPAVAAMAVALALASAATPHGQILPRARALGVPFSGVAGPLNAITDVGGVEVGHTTIVRGEGPLVVGQGPVRTGVTAVLPRGKRWAPVFAGWFAGNGFGEMTGAPWVVEGGVLGGPVMITGTYSVGAVRDAVNSWFHESLKQEIPWHQPVVGETSDAFLNDGQGQHVTKGHVFAALDGARPGPVPEGNVGGGTGMVAHGFKGGIGTASRVTGGYTVGVLVQANYGTRESLTIAGVPVGREIAGAERRRAPAPPAPPADRDGSIIVVVAIDAPLLPHQLERIARRVPMGIARLGGTASNGSGDIFIAFSTANPGAAAETGATAITWLPNGDLTPLFDATVQATEEAIVNALVAAQTMTGVNGNTAHALPTDQLQAVLQKYRPAGAVSQGVTPGRGTDLAPQRRMTQKTDNPAPHAGERERTRVQDGKPAPSDGSPNSGKGIPPLPEPNVEGVGEESGPSAGKTGLKGEKLSPGEAKKVKDATGL